MTLNIRNELLDLLANGPSSFAALHAFAARQNAVALTVDRTWRELQRLEQEELVQAFRMTTEGKFRAPSDAERHEALERYREWLGRLTAAELSIDAVSLDEVGLWYALTEAGSGAVLSGTAADGMGAWAIDWTERDRRITVYAAEEGSAQRALQVWLVAHPCLRVRGSPELETIDRFRTRTGIEVAPAVKLVAQLEPESCGTETFSTEK